MEEEGSLPKIVESNSDQHREIFSSNRNFSLAFQKKKKKTSFHCKEYGMGQMVFCLEIKH